MSFEYAEIAVMALREQRDEALGRVAELQARITELEAQLAMPNQVRAVLLACVREVIDAEGRTPALEAARAWLVGAKGANNA